MADPKMPSRRISDREIGFRIGIAVAVGLLVHGYGKTTLATSLLATSGVTLAKARMAGATECDLKAIRKAARHG